MQQLCVRPRAPTSVSQKPERREWGADLKAASGEALTPVTENQELVDQETSIAQPLGR